MKSIATLIRLKRWALDELAFPRDLLGVDAHLGEVAVPDRVDDEPEQVLQAVPGERVTRGLVVRDVRASEGRARLLEDRLLGVPEHPHDVHLDLLCMPPW